MSLSVLPTLRVINYYQRELKKAPDTLARNFYKRAIKEALADLAHPDFRASLTKRFKAGKIPPHKMQLIAQASGKALLGFEPKGPSAASLQKKEALNLIDKFIEVDQAYKQFAEQIAPSGEKEGAVLIDPRAELVVVEGKVEVIRLTDSKLHDKLNHLLTIRTEAKKKCFEALFALNKPDYLHKLYSKGRVSSDFISSYQRFVEKNVRKEAQVQVVVKKAVDRFKAGLTAKKEAQLMSKAEDLVTKIQTSQCLIESLTLLADPEAVTATLEIRAKRDEDLKALADPAYTSLVLDFRKSGRVDDAFIKRYQAAIKAVQASKSAAASEAKGSASE